jgi:hypothetical protein
MNQAFWESHNEAAATKQIEYDQQLLGIDENGNDESVPSNKRSSFRISTNGHSEELKEPDAGVQF